MKLVPAKCPSCGADIEVNKDLEKTICQYCGTTVLIDDAVQKYKLEITGKVKVDGVKGRDDFLEQAKKHLKVKEYSEAIASLEEIISEDKFDVEAYCELIKNYVAMFKPCKYNPYQDEYCDNYDEAMEATYQNICTNFDRVIKIDEKKEYKKYLEGYVDDVEKYYELWGKIKNIKTEAKAIVKEMEKVHYKSMNDNWEDLFYDKVKEAFEISGPLQRCYYAAMTDKDTYENREITHLSLDGTIRSKYSNVTMKHSENPFDEYIDIVPDKFCETPEELQKRIDNFRASVEDMKQEGEKVGNKRNKNDKKIKMIWLAVKILLYIALVFVIFLGVKETNKEDPNDMESLIAAVIISIIPVLIIHKIKKKIDLS